MEKGSNRRTQSQPVIIPLNQNKNLISIPISYQKKSKSNIKIIYDQNKGSYIKYNNNTGQQQRAYKDGSLLRKFDPRISGIDFNKRKQKFLQNQKIIYQSKNNDNSNSNNSSGRKYIAQNYKTQVYKPINDNYLKKQQQQKKNYFFDNIKALNKHVNSANLKKKNFRSYVSQKNLKEFQMIKLQEKERLQLYHTNSNNKNNDKNRIKAQSSKTSHQNHLKQSNIKQFFKKNHKINQSSASFSPSPSFHLYNRIYSTQINQNLIKSKYQNQKLQNAILVMSQYQNNILFQTNRSPMKDIVPGSDQFKKVPSYEIMRTMRNSYKYDTNDWKNKINNINYQKKDNLSFQYQTNNVNNLIDQKSNKKDIIRLKKKVATSQRSFHPNIPQSQQLKNIMKQRNIFLKYHPQNKHVQNPITIRRDKQRKIKFKELQENHKKQANVDDKIYN